MIKQDFVELVKKAKQDSQCMMEVIEIMQPLIKSYVKKIFFMDKLDAEQEIILAIIEAIYSISRCDTTGECFTYISNAIKFKFVQMCKKNMKREKIEDIYEKDFDNEIYIEKYDYIEEKYDLNVKLSNIPKKQKEILKYLLLGYSDSEIGKKMGLSRQYINRIKKRFY